LSVKALEVQFAAMRRIIGHDCPPFDVDLVTNGVTRLGLRYRVSGTRKSGNADTTVGNSILMGLLHMRVKDEVHSYYRAIVMGDDTLVCVPFDVLAYAAWVVREIGARLGFSMKVECATSWRYARFCSCRFFMLPRGGWRPAGLPGRVLAKFGFRLLGEESVTNQDWLRSCAHAMACEFLHVPFMRSVALALCRYCFGVVTYEEALAFANSHSYREFGSNPRRLYTLGVRNAIYQGDDCGAMAEFCLTYDVSPALVRDEECRVLAMKHPPFDLRSAFTDRLIEVDLP
jgi:hypothetical protein